MRERTLRSREQLEREREEVLRELHGEESKGYTHEDYLADLRAQFRAIERDLATGCYALVTDRRVE